MKYQEGIVPWVGDEAVAQAAQRSCVEVFQAELDGAWSSLVWWKVAGNRIG